MTDNPHKKWKDLVDLTPTAVELLSEEIDGEVYLYEGSARCKICNLSDDLRMIVDTLLIYPKSYREVLRSIQPLQEKLGVPEKDRINYENLRNHFKKHLPMEKQLVRETVERRASEKNKKVLDQRDSLLTGEALLDVIVHMGFQDLANGYVRPTLSQTMKAMEMLRDIEEAKNTDYRPEDLINQLDIILQAIREVLPNEMKDALFRRIEEYQTSNPAKSPAGALEAGDIEYIDDDLYLDDDEL